MTSELDRYDFARFARRTIALIETGEAMGQKPAQMIADIKDLAIRWELAEIDNEGRFVPARKVLQ